MKFGDKLIELRKKNGYSQEELAEKLGVSRQSVSKWESNNTYPETDKIVQIANLFDCSMDDLINDKVTDVESSLRKNKNNIEKIWKSLLEFITNTVEMFSKMNFSQGLKCILELVILTILLNIGGSILCGSAANVIANIFSFLSDERVSLIREILKSVFHLVWFIIAIIVIVHTFKIRHLNGYEKDKKVKEEKEMKENNNKTEKTTTTSQTINTTTNKPAEFLGTLAQIVIIFIKFFAFWILVGTVFSTIGLVVASIIVLAHIPVHILFLWIAILLIAASVISSQIIGVLISFIFDRKINIVSNIILFISCVIVCGLSIGMIAITASKINYITDKSPFNPTTETINIEYKENLVIESHGDGLSNSYVYIIDNEMADNQITASREIDKKYYKMSNYETTMDEMPVIKVSQVDNGNPRAFYNLFIKNLKKNKIYTFGEYGEDPLIIKANEDTINKLIENQKKLFLIEEERQDNQINVIVHDDKVYFPHGLEGKYNAIDDTITYDVDDYSCKKEIESTKYGERIIYTCDYKEEEEE